MTAKIATVSIKTNEDEKGFSPNLSHFKLFFFYYIETTLAQNIEDSIN